ncbi:hypothetical protein HANVADRAFT_54348 [Hanseniaspora valbyensis NRRL Y-1626]|uniref:Uncharacterized protein n=1 Tax=Hanseniaspora valbyensis NRRL Y-1626 TaxID=766949 RepID=A0A1B7T7J2_9ASCO|nr:hypothetical protein HANVADRAFT_54348 [Hanseniaspora valbyensis NRRL Y-1626]
MSSNILDLHYSEDENINIEDRQNSSNLLSSVSPSKKKLSSISPVKKSRQTSPIRRQPLGNKNSNNSTSILSTIGISDKNSNSSNITYDNVPSLNISNSIAEEVPLNSNEGRKWLRKNITVTKTGSFAANYDNKSSTNLKNLSGGLATSPLRKSQLNNNGVIKYKSLVLNDFGIADKHDSNKNSDNSNDDDDDDLKDELKSFWASKGKSEDNLELDLNESKTDNKNDIFNDNQQKDSKYEFKDSKSNRKLLNSKKKFTLYDEVEFVPSKPKDLVDQSVEEHSDLSRDDKRKLNEFKAPFSEIYKTQEKESIKKEFLRLNNKDGHDNQKDKENIDPYSLQEINISRLIDNQEDNSNNTTDSKYLPEEKLEMNQEKEISLDEFDEILKKNGYDCKNIELDF